MTRRQKDPLRPLTQEEHSILDEISRARSEPASHVERAKILLAVADGATDTAAARSVGRRSNDAVADLVARFNREGVAALAPRHGGGPAIHYAAAERERILTEFRRTPDRAQDGTAPWSLTTLQRALRRARRLAPRQHVHDLVCPARGRLHVAAESHLVRHRHRGAQAQGGADHRH